VTNPFFMGPQINNECYDEQEGSADGKSGQGSTVSSGSASFFGISRRPAGQLANVS
jgi:hypothetical protein